jgi:hypothetical protein
MDWIAEELGFDFRKVQRDSGANTSSYRVGTGGCFPGLKRRCREASYSPLIRTEVKNRGVIPLLSISLLGLVLN